MNRLIIKPKTIDELNMLIAKQMEIRTAALATCGYVYKSKYELNEKIYYGWYVESYDINNNEFICKYDYYQSKLMLFIIGSIKYEDTNDLELYNWMLNYSKSDLTKIFNDNKDSYPHHIQLLKDIYWSYY